MFRKSVSMMMFFCIVICCSGCVTMSTKEKYQYKDISSRLHEVGMEEEKTKSPGLAGGLNLLPGVGNAYLGQWDLFAINFLMWPVGIIWSVPQAAGDAKMINKKDTVYYYTEGEGKKKLEEVEAGRK